MARTTHTSCPITGQPGAISEGLDLDAERVSSPATLGPVTYTRSLLAVLGNRGADEKRAFGRWIVDRKQFGGLPKIVNRDYWNKYRAYPEWSLTERADRLFHWVLRERQGIEPLAPFYLTPDHPDRIAACAVSDSVSENQLLLVLSILAERGHIEFVTLTNKPGSGAQPWFRLTPAGWVASEHQPTGRMSDRTFVAMWFSSETEDLKEAISDGVRHAGYVPIIIDREEYTGLIVDQIMKEIKSARFVIADYTCGYQQGSESEEHYQARGGVYWEAGYAQGLGLTVISSVRRDLFGKPGALHFDQAQFNHLSWQPDKLHDFEEQLRDRIVALVGWGPHRLN